MEVAYNLDVFGRTRRQVETLEATTENQRFQLDAAHLTLTSNVVAAAFQEASLRAQIEATRKVIQAHTEVLELYNKQLSLGSSRGPTWPSSMRPWPSRRRCCPRW